MDKLTIILLIVGGIALSAVGGTAYVLKLKLETANATIETKDTEIAAKTRELKEAKGDLNVSKQNSDRMLAEKDIALEAADDRANEQIERAGQFAHITKEIANAPPPKTGESACADSPAVAAALGGLRDLQSSTSTGGHQPSDNRVSTGQDPGPTPDVQRPADHH